MRWAAQEIVDMGARNVVVKGGHLDRPGHRPLLRRRATTTSSPRRASIPINTHGTGCTFASAIAASLAKGSGRAAGGGDGEGVRYQGHAACPIHWARDTGPCTTSSGTGRISSASERAVGLEAGPGRPTCRNGATVGTGSGPRLTLPVEGRRHRPDEGSSRRRRVWSRSWCDRRSRRAGWPYRRTSITPNLNPIGIGSVSQRQDQRQHRQLRCLLGHRDGAVQAAGIGQLRRRHGDGPQLRRRHRRHPRSDHQGQPAARGHGARSIRWRRSWTAWRT